MPPLTTEELIRRLDTDHAELKDLHSKTDNKIDGIVGRLTSVEQSIAARRPGGGGAPSTWGQALIDSAEFKTLAASGSQRGRASVRVPTIRSMITSVGLSGGSGGALVMPDVRTDPVMLPQLRPTVRSLLAPGQTSGNTVYYAAQTVRTNLAAVVTEGALKPESDIEFEQRQAPVATIATYVIGSRQLMDDAPAMMSTVDAELTYMLAYAEEQELLFGDGLGAHLKGLVPSATQFNAPFTVAAHNNADTLIEAIAQAEQALLPATGIVLNTIDWLKMLALKDNQNRYLSNGPFGPANSRRLWDLPVAPTMAMTQGEFLVGSFAIAAQIFDRMEAEVLVSSEDSDNFRKNLITIRAEKRLAMAVKRSQAIIHGEFLGAT